MTGGPARFPQLPGGQSWGEWWGSRRRPPVLHGHRCGRGGGRRAAPRGVRPQRARCQASSCSRRRAGGGPGAPRGPAAADANLCPPAQRAAGDGAGGLGGGHPGSPGIAASAGASLGVAAASPVGTGCHGMWGRFPPPRCQHRVPAVPCLPQSLPVPHSSAASQTNTAVPPQVSSSPPVTVSPICPSAPVPRSPRNPCPTPDSPPLNVPVSSISLFHPVSPHPTSIPL